MGVVVGYVKLAYMVHGLFDAVLSDIASTKNIEESLEAIADVARKLGMRDVENKAMTIESHIRAGKTGNLEDELYELVDVTMKEMAQKLDVIRTLIGACEG